MKHIVKHFNIHAKAENENRSQTFWGQTRMRGDETWQSHDFGFIYFIDGLHLTAALLEVPHKRLCL